MHRIQYPAGARNTAKTLLDIIGACAAREQGMCTHRCKEYAVHCSQLELLLDLQCGEKGPASCINTDLGAKCAACCASTQQTRQPRLTCSRNCAQVKLSGTGTATFLQRWRCRWWSGSPFLGSSYRSPIRLSSPARLGVFHRHKH